MDHLYLNAGRRLAMRESDFSDGWYISWSPRNDNQNAEGDWGEWVDLARQILAEDQRRKAEH